jgi:hypothetical protein
MSRFSGMNSKCKSKKFIFRYIYHSFVALQKFSHYFTIVFALWFSITFLLTVLDDCHTAYSTENDIAHHLSSPLSEDLHISLYWF